MAIEVRKAEHLTIAAEDGVEHRAGTGLESVRLRHRALPGRDLSDVDLGVPLLGARLAAPIVVSAMTGGTASARSVNQELARAAASAGVGMVLGSGRALLADPELLDTYRCDARPPLLLANLGVVGLSVRHATRVVELLGADGLSVHLNPIQEAVQPEGEPCFGDALERIAAVVDALRPLPVVVKEVGFGMSARDVVELRNAGIAAVDVAGAGGTNWATIEGRRSAEAGALASAFADWGVPTARALVSAHRAAPGLPLIGSGGVRDGVDVARCLALGASAAGMARPLLVAAQAGRAAEALATVVEQLRIAVWACGAAGAASMGEEHLAS